MRRHALLVGIVLVAVGCGGGTDSSSTTDPTDAAEPGTATNGTFTAQINGVTWNAQGTVSVNRSSNNFIGLGAAGLTTSNNTYALVLSFGSAAATGNYSLAYLNPGGSSLIVGTPTLGWGTSLSGGTGTATITTLTSNRIAGTFIADAMPNTARTMGTMQVRNGRFDIRF